MRLATTSRFEHDRHFNPATLLSRMAVAGFDVAPGLTLCIAVTGAALAIEATEHHLFGRAWVEALVLAIVIGTGVRSVCTPGVRWNRGIAFASKTLLEIAVALLGASVSLRTLADAGPALLFGIVGIVAVAIPAGFAVGRLLGLSRRMAILVACGNAICGNSAIAAVAPVIGAACEEIAASIAFTAVLGVVVVLALPPLAASLGASAAQYGVFAGLTVYAVPQVIAATAPMGAVSIQLGTLVKLVRVLMLGPVILAISLVASRQNARDGTASTKPVQIRTVVPWFIAAFLLLATAHALNMIPAAVLQPTATAASRLTIVSMAALGLGVDLRTVARAGARVTTAACLSLLVLALVSGALIHGLGIA